jgi:2-oxoglutarate ferredoxin oxidoreductase subunit alpha
MAQMSPEIINDFSITVSTINGSGSATANTTIMRALFKMGIPVSGRNIFPSNIKGLPTWFTIRVSKDGYRGRIERDHIVIAMNPEAIEGELDYIEPGGVLLYADNIKFTNTRDDIFAYPMPVNTIMKDSKAPYQLRTFVSNMVYVGVLAQLIGIDLKAVYSALEYHFQGKEKPLKMNYEIVEEAAKWAKDNLEKRDNYWVKPMDDTKNMILADGNSAGALGSIYGGVQFCGWYPITPASSLAESLNEYLPLLRNDPETGKATYAVVQAEDELAAIGMCIGAGWSGLRSMTSTSGPGMSLMAEYMGLAYYSEVPVVVWNVQRVGPSTGLPTRTSQGDMTSAYFLSHGDTDYPILIPGSVKECFEFGWRALDLADELQTPVIVLIDLDLGMNYWMSPKFEYPNEPIKRGKVLWEKDLDEMIEKFGEWGRYLDVDKDQVPHRTVPGNLNPKAAYFARGTGHDDFAKYSEDPDTWERGMKRLKDKYLSAKKLVPAPVIEKMDGAKIGVITYGSNYYAVEEARDLLLEQGIPTDYLRIRALPYTDDVYEFIKKHDHCYVIENNRDGQLKQLLTLEYPDQAYRLKKLSRINGLALSAEWISENILEGEGK